MFSKIEIILLISFTVVTSISCWQLLYIGSYEEINKAFVHLFLIFFGIMFFYRISGDKYSLSIVDERWVKYFFVFAILQVTMILSTRHYPRLTSMLINPNELSTLFLVSLLLLKRKTDIFQSTLLTVSGGSLSAIPLLIFRFPVLIILVIPIVIFNGDLIFELFFKATSFFGLLFQADNLGGFVNDGSESLSAYRRVSYIVYSINQFFSMDSWLSFNLFQFREGAIWTLTSIWPGFGILVFVFIFNSAIKLIKSKRIILLGVLFIWGFLTPVITPMFFLFFKFDKNSQI
ncbi:hypothetical protein [Vibrio diabolicus]|uniref:hypothetical protein n=1 Tax=Vibrio diabolicus TaxID=50719 RepID=UPI002494D07A|nr:hypothetical protein [Vibrio diabolicus]